MFLSLCSSFFSRPVGDTFQPLLGSVPLVVMSALPPWPQPWARGAGRGARGAGARVSPPGCSSTTADSGLEGGEPFPDGRQVVGPALQRAAGIVRAGCGDIDPGPAPVLFSPLSHSPMQAGLAG